MVDILSPLHSCTHYYRLVVISSPVYASASVELIPKLNLVFTYLVLQDNVQRLCTKFGFPQAAAIDGTHIPIQAPVESTEDYFNRKHFYSVLLQIEDITEDMKTSLRHRELGRTSTKIKTTLRHRELGAQHLNENKDIATTDFVHDPAADMKTTPYSKLKEGLIGSHGVMEWRIHDNAVDIVAFNDINLDSGSFTINNFVHMVRQVTLSNEVLFSCNCKLATTLKRENAGYCCHVRFFKEEVEPFYSSFPPTTNDNTPLGQLIKLSMCKINNCIVQLDQDKFHHRFSIISPDMLSCVIVRLEGKRFSCLGGRCRATKGHTRKTSCVGDTTNCPHIMALHANRESWCDLVEEDEDDEENQEDQEDQEKQERPETSEVCS